MSEFLISMQAILDSSSKTQMLRRGRRNLASKCSAYGGDDRPHKLDFLDSGTGLYHLVR